MFTKRSAKELHVQPFDVLGDIRQRMVRNQIESNVRITKSQVEIDQRHAMVLVLRQRATEVGRKRRAADSAAQSRIATIREPGLAIPFELFSGLMR